MATQQLLISDFYYACRNNDIDLVKSLLETMTPDEIDKLEANGDTALHAASRHRHYEIVKFLLEKGASRSIKNKHNHIPYEEGRTDTIKQLFSRKNAAHRFVGDTNNAIEWIRIGEHIDQEAKAVRKMLKAYSQQQNKKKDKKILVEMISLGNYKGIDKIQWYFDEANNKNDPIYILKAYTEETEFYGKLNQTLARVHELNPNDANQHQILDFLQLICCHSSFQKYEFHQGRTYRGMKMTTDDLEQYKVGSKIMTKTLLSTSKSQDIAEQFATKSNVTTDGDTINRSCICIYKIRKAHTVLDIQELSMYPSEQEVLIIPYSAFEVTNIQEINSKYGVVTEIKLRQCKSYIQTQTAIAAGGGGLFITAIGLLARFINDDEEDQD